MLKLRILMILTMLTNDGDVVAGLRMDVKRSGFCLRRFRPFEAGPFAHWSHTAASVTESESDDAHRF